MGSNISTSWYDAKGCVRLSENVPVVTAKRQHAVTVYPSGVTASGSRSWWCARTSGMLRLDEAEVCVNFENPQGFGYALRLFMSTYGDTELVTHVLADPAILRRYLHSTTTAGDILLVSQAWVFATRGVDARSV